MRTPGGNVEVRDAVGESTPHPSDGELVRRAQGGDVRAFGVLFERHRGVVQRACRRLVANAADAEEIAQEVFVRTFESVPRLDPERPLRPWLVTVARNLCIDRARAMSAVPLEALKPGEETSQARHDMRDPTAESAIKRLTISRLWGEALRALGSLDARDRRLLVSRDLEGRGYRELSANEGESVDALRNRVWRARTVVLEKVAQFREEVRTLGGIAPAAHSLARQVPASLRGGGATLGRIDLPAWSWVAGALLATIAGLLAVRTLPTAPRLDDAPTRPPPARAPAAQWVPSPDTVPPGERRGASRAPASRPEGDRSVVRAAVDAERQRDAAAPRRARMRIEIWSPDGGLLYWYEQDTECDFDSATLPGTGIVRAYC